LALYTSYDDRWEWDDDILCYDGVPFTGMVQDRYPDRVLESEEHYRDGFVQNYKKWYPTGKLKEELLCLLFSPYSVCKYHKSIHTCWHPNGSVKSICHYEYGLEVEYNEWDEEGKLVENRMRDPNDKLWVKLRKIYGDWSVYEG
jgi:antitoxin component YwqK of YwqJK toxin-antitoxin module